MPARPEAPHPALEQFAQRLIELRRAKGLSQERLAMESGLARGYLGEVERARRNLSLINIWRLAAALQEPPHRLLEAPGT